MKRQFYPFHTPSSSLIDPIMTRIGFFFYKKAFKATEGSENSGNPAIKLVKLDA